MSFTNKKITHAHSRRDVFECICSGARGWKNNFVPLISLFCCNCARNSALMWREARCECVGEGKNFSFALSLTHSKFSSSYFVCVDDVGKVLPCLMEILMGFEVAWWMADFRLFFFIKFIDFNEKIEENLMTAVQFSFLSCETWDYPHGMNLHCWVIVCVSINNHRIFLICIF